MPMIEKYGRLTLLSGAGEKRLFRCDCGVEKMIYYRNALKGLSQSCGCLHKERASQAKTTHGHSRGGKITPEYQTYRSMIARCTRPTNVRFAEYGGRGIKVCDRWLRDFSAFYADMGQRPSPAHSIDRVDNDADYEPSNCRWATRHTQARNKRNNIVLVAFGESMALSEASHRYGIPYTTLKARILKFGWSHERAISEPVRPMRFVRDVSRGP